MLWISLILHGWCANRCFGMIDVLAWLMLWHGQCFGAINGLALSILWHCRCFDPVDILERLMFWRSCTNAGERQSLRDLKYQHYLNIDCFKTLITPKKNYCGIDYYIKALFFYICSDHKTPGSPTELAFAAVVTVSGAFSCVRNTLSSQSCIWLRVNVPGFNLPTLVAIL